MSHLTKRVISAAASVVLPATLSLPAAAHGGHHGEQLKTTSYCNTCGICHSMAAHTPRGHHGGGHH